LGTRRLGLAYPLDVKWAGLLLVISVLGACSAPAPRAPTNAPATEPPAATPVVVLTLAPRSVPVVALPTLQPVGVASPVALPLSVLAGRNGADVRVALNLLLQEQVFLTAAAMNAASNARLDELIGVTPTLDQNSVLLAQVLGVVKGQATAVALLDAWRGQVADQVAYSRGQPAVALADLDRRWASIAGQLAMADFSVAAADDLLRRRTQAQLDVADSLIRHDSAEAIRRVRVAAAGSDELARPLAAAIARQLPALAPPPTEGLDIDVRIGLSRALQEHTYLTGAAFGAAADNRALDLEALNAAAGQNAMEFGAQVGSVWGPDLGNGLADRLRAETATLVSAASGGDRRQSATDLDRLRGELDGLLAAANPLLPKGLLAQQLRASDQPLLTAADAFAARDFLSAYSRLREAARQSQKPAESIALSIIDRFPGRYLVLPTPVLDAP
jgi:hypothetical protein